MAQFIAQFKCVIEFEQTKALGELVLIWLNLLLQEFRMQIDKAHNKVFDIASQFGKASDPK